ncbi:hypothetical protein JYB87_09230 [Shewanella avicenniae]|uniref:Uncharacterized protein n=1 Tax=Shewanella avicenniae TaxID=2814294 RepID=A0ABX7QWE0_9GAMM|nr:hypothetical protein [Shewanella avicenniae]QSX35347.1 hypothetical protein JYB87_09230 [Shewanella avicenniae]
MNEEITIEFEGVTVTAEYSVFGDTLSVYLPNGEIRKTELRGLKPRSATLVHLRSYASELANKK